MKQKHFINTHKGITGFTVLLMMWAYDQWHNPTAWIYLALHGAYGCLWVLKSHFFPDKTWEQKSGWGYGFIIWLGLSLYWVAPWLITSREIWIPAWYQAICIIMYSVGIFFHFSADMQKYITLKLRPETLISTGLWHYCRNPNYFGELLIYLGFGLLAMHWLPILILGLFIWFVWLPNMQRKDRSLARYPKFESYRAQTKLFIPFVY